MSYNAVIPTFVLIVNFEIQLSYRQITYAGNIVISNTFFKGNVSMDTVIPQNRHNSLFAFEDVNPISRHSIKTIAF